MAYMPLPAYKNALAPPRGSLPLDASAAAACLGGRFSLRAASRWPWGMHGALQHVQSVLLRLARPALPHSWVAFMLRPKLK